MRRSVLAAITVIRSQINTTTTFLVLALDAKVTVLSPLGGPRVTDQPVRSKLLISSVTYQKDGVVDVRVGLVASIKDTRFVLEPGGSVNTDGNRSLKNCKFYKSMQMTKDEGRRRR